MRNLKGDSLRTVLLALLVSAVFSLTLVQAKDYTVGVKAGDWIKYQVTWTGNETQHSQLAPIFECDWVKLDVISEAGITATINGTLHYSNGTQTSETANINIEDRLPFSFIYASNLTTGDPVNPFAYQTINQTVTRMFARENRNVNVIDETSSFGDGFTNVQIFFDKNSGIMVEVDVTVTNPYDPSVNMEASIKATETNIWSANALDLLQDNLIYIIAGIAVTIVIVAATIVIRRRKPLSPQQAPPPPSSAPPPPAS